jgi:hypothetical protein
VNAPWTERRKKGRKIHVAGDKMPDKRDEITVMPLLRIGMQSKRRFSRRKRHHMGGTGRKNEAPKKPDDKSKKPEHVPAEDDDYEDGDIATPKRDRHGNDDEPL